jgi:hypothetical protein
MAEEEGITPPVVVERALYPEAALAAFIAQELEHWGFEVRLPHGGGGKTIEVDTPRRRFEVTVE